MVATLTWYSPDERLASHSHDQHQVSWLLAGEFVESAASRNRELCCPSIGFKAAGLDHSNRYGRNGALILAINLPEATAGSMWPARQPDWHWSAARGRDSQAARLAYIATRSPQDARDSALDLLALASAGEPSHAAPAPRWAERARERLADPGDCAPLDTIADDEGVHRVHLSRTFTRCFGLAPSLYRRRCRLVRAVRQIADGVSLSAAAADAGFADQAHLTRESCKLIGLTPRHLQSSFRAG